MDFGSNSVADRKSIRDWNFLSNYHKNQDYLRKLKKGQSRSASDLIKFLSQNGKESCDRLQLLGQGKRGAMNTKRFEAESVPIFEKILEYKCYCNST